MTQLQCGTLMDKQIRDKSRIHTNHILPVKSRILIFVKSKYMKMQLSGTDTIEFHILPQTPNGKGTQTSSTALSKTA